MLILASLSPSLIYIGSQGWWLPIFGAIVAIIGLHSRLSKFVDIGSLLLVGSFLFLVRGLPLNYMRLIFVISIFFIYIGLWLFMRRALFLMSMNRTPTRKTENGHLEEYKKDSAIYYLRTLLLGFAISLLGGFIAVNSFIGPYPSNLVFFLRILFALSLVFSIYFALFLLPKYVAR